jgi:hypothetical protein
MSVKQVQDEKDEILELIRWIDKQKCKLFKWWYVFTGWGIVTLIGLLLILFCVVGLTLVEAIVIKIVFIDTLAVDLSLLGVVFSYFALLAQLGEGNIIRVNYDKAIRLRADFTMNQRIPLKALIKIKVKNPQFDLEELYNKDNTLFEKKKLLEMLLQ